MKMSLIRAEVVQLRAQLWVQRCVTLTEHSAHASQRGKYLHIYIHMNILCINS